MTGASPFLSTATRAEQVLAGREQLVKAKESALGEARKERRAADDTMQAGAQPVLDPGYLGLSGVYAVYDVGPLHGFVAQIVLAGNAQSPRILGSGRGKDRQGHSQHAQESSRDAKQARR